MSLSSSTLSSSVCRHLMWCRCCTLLQYCMMHNLSHFVNGTVTTRSSCMIVWWVTSHRVHLLNVWPIKHFPYSHTSGYRPKGKYSIISNLGILNWSAKHQQILPRIFYRYHYNCWITLLEIANNQQKTVLDKLVMDLDKAHKLEQATCQQSSCIFKVAWIKGRKSDSFKVLVKSSSESHFPVVVS